MMQQNEPTWIPEVPRKFLSKTLVLVLVLMYQQVLVLVLHETWSGSLVEVWSNYIS